MHAVSKAGMGCSIHCKAIRPEIKEVEETEEGRVILGQKRVYAPSGKEYEDHIRTHIPYRRWCECCVRGKAKNTAHTSAVRSHYEVPIIAYDYRNSAPKQRVKKGVRLCLHWWALITIPSGYRRIWYRRRDLTSMLCFVW